MKKTIIALAATATLFAGCTSGTDEPTVTTDELWAALEADGATEDGCFAHMFLGEDGFLDMAEEEGLTDSQATLTWDALEENC